MYRRHLFIDFPPKELNFPEVKTYLQSILVGKFDIKRGRKKGGKKASNLKLIINCNEDFNILTRRTHRIRGEELKVQRFLSKDQRIDLVKKRLLRRVYVNNLPLDATEEDLFEIFGQFGRVQEVFTKLKKVDGSEHKYMACYVTFDTAEGVRRCAEKQKNSINFKDTNHVLQLMRPGEGYSETGVGDNLVPLCWVDDMSFCAQAGDNQPQKSTVADMMMEKEREPHYKQIECDYRKKPKKKVWANKTQRKAKKNMKKEKQEVKVPFISLGENCIQNLDWMGYLVNDQFMMSKTRERQKYEEYEKVKKIEGKEFKYSNIRYNFPIFPQQRLPLKYRRKPFVKKAKRGKAKGKK